MDEKITEELNIVEDFSLPTYEKTLENTEYDFFILW